MKPVWSIPLLMCLVFLVNTQKTSEKERQPLGPISNRRMTMMVNDLQQAKKELYQYKNRVANLEQELAQLKSLIHEVESLKQDIQQVQEIEAFLKLIPARMPESKPAEHDGIPNINETYAFSAFATKEAYYGDGETILFKGLLYRQGDIYNEQLSLYGCLVSGLYFFSVNVRLKVNATILAGDVSIVRNNEKIGSVKLSLEDNQTEKRAHGSQSVLVYCEKGDVVSVRANDNAYIERTSSSGDRHYSTFSGYLVGAV